MSTNIWQTLLHLLIDLGTLIVQLGSLGLRWSLLLVWTAWWLFGVDWVRIRLVLRQGGWAPLVLLMLVAALAWSQITPAVCDCLGIPIANFWWQLGAIGLITAYTFFLGWMQTLMGWTPAEIELAPPVEQGHHAH